MRFKGHALRYILSGFRFDVGNINFSLRVEIGVNSELDVGKTFWDSFLFSGEKMGKVSRVYASLGYLKFRKLM